MASRRDGEGRRFISCRLCLRTFQAITATHLVRKHQFDPDHPILDYRERVRTRQTRCLDSLGRLRKGIRGHFERIGRRWTRKRVVEVIRNMLKDRRPLNSAWVSEHRNDLMMAAMHHFRSWERAIRAAGLVYESIRLVRSWSEREITDALRKMARDGEAMNSAAASRRSPALVQAARKRFGNWSAALRRVGIDPEKVAKARRWSRARILEAIRSLPRPLRAYEIKRIASGLEHAAKTRFGSWAFALRRAGFAYPKLYEAKRWPRQKVLETIRARSREGRPIRSRDIEEELNGLWEAGRREFGSWPEAVAAAGVAYPAREWKWKWPRSRVLEVLQERVQACRPLGRSSVEREVRGLVRAAQRCFGSWPRALEAAGIRPVVSP